MPAQSPELRPGNERSLPSERVHHVTRIRPLAGTALMLGLLVLLVLAARYNYNLFHGLAEGFSIVVAFGVFLVAWNSRTFARNEYLLFVGIAFAFVAGVDFLHVLAYKGMNVFYGFDSDLPTQLWLIARFLQTLALLIAPLFLGRGLRARWVLAGSAVLTSGLLLSVFVVPVFPAAFVEGVGLTTFKKAAELALCGLLLVALDLLRRRRGYFAPAVWRLLAASIVMTIASELLFTLYVDPYGLFNVLGHFLKLVSFYLVYKAIIQTSLVRPYDLLFREVKQSEESLRRSQEYFRATFEQAAVGIAHVDLQDRFLRVNQRFAHLLGYDEVDLVGVCVGDLIDPDDREADRETLAALLRGEESPMAERRYVRKDGSPLWARVSRSLVSRSRDEPAYTVAVMEDITAEKHAQLEREQLLARLQAVTQIGELALSTLELDQLFERLVPQLVELTQSDAAIVMLRERDRLLTGASVGLGLENDPGFFLELGQGLAGRVAAEETSRYVEDAQAQPTIVSEVLERQGVRSMLGVPLRAGGEVLGVVEVMWTTVRPFDESLLRLLQLLADRLASALNNARQFEEQRIIAETLQAAILAVPESVPGLSFGHLYRSASRRAQVGGDFYDVFRLGEHKVAVLVGDVVGHGLEAATTASFTRETIRAYAFEDERPDRVLRKANRALLKRYGLPVYATVCLTLLDLRTGDLQYSSAAHPAPLLRREDGSLVELSLPHLPLGAFEDVEYRLGRLTLNPCDQLLLYTDGLIEARRDGELFGEARLIRAFQASDVGVEALPEALFGLAERHARGDLLDDVAILAVALTGPCPSSVVQAEAPRASAVSTPV